MSSSTSASPWKPPAATVDDIIKINFWMKEARGTGPRRVERRMGEDCFPD